MAGNERKASVWIELEPTKGEAFAIRCPYHPEFVDGIKVVPPSERSWDGVHKVWIVERQHWKKVKDLVQRVYGDESIKYGPAAEAAFIENMVDETLLDDPNAMDYTHLGIRADAPTCVVHAAWLAIEDAFLGNTPPWNDGKRGDLSQAVAYLTDARPAYERICRLRGFEPLPRRVADYLVDQAEHP